MSRRMLSYLAALLGLPVAVGTFPVNALADLVIANAPNQNVSCAGGVCTATATNAVLSASRLKSMLGTSSVTVSTGSAANNIDVNAAISWTSGSSLTLQALISIIVSRPISDAGAGGVSLSTNSSGGTSGVLQFVSPG